MAAARCSYCDINFPYDHNLCDACGGATWQLRSEQDTWEKDWRDQVARIKKRHRTGTPIPDLRAKDAIVEREGRLYVQDALLQGCGYHDLESGSVVKVNGGFYEVLAAVSGIDDETRQWWIQVVPTEGVWPNEFPVLSNFDYQALQAERLR